MSAILSERISPPEERAPSNNFASRVKLLKTGSSSVLVPSLPSVNSITCGASGSVYDQYDEAAKTLLDWYPSVPHPLLISVLNNVKGDSEKAVYLLNQILELNREEEIKYRNNNFYNDSGVSDHNSVLIDVESSGASTSTTATTTVNGYNNSLQKYNINNQSIQADIQEDNRKRWRTDSSSPFNNTVTGGPSDWSVREVGIADESSIKNITEYELRKKHSMISNDVVSLIIDQANGNLLNADRSLNKLVEESLPSMQNDNELSSARSAVLRHALGVNLMSINTDGGAAFSSYLKDMTSSNEPGSAERQYNKIMDILLEYEKELAQSKAPPLPDVSKCLARSVISQNDKLNMISAKLTEVEQQLTESQEQREKVTTERDEIRNQCDQLLGIIQQLQIRIENNEKGSTLFFNSFQGPPPGSCY